MIRLVLVAASPRARRELEFRLDAGEMEVVGSAPGLEMAGEELAETEADVVLVGVGDEAREELLDALEETRLPRETPVMLLVERSSANFAHRAIAAGVKGILSADVGDSSLRSGVAAVASGLLVFSPQEVGALQPVLASATDSAEAIEALTPRENEVLQRMASGLANKEIAVRMKISEHTVKFHVASILGKLGAASRTEAVSIGMRRGLILL